MRNNFQHDPRNEVNSGDVRANMECERTDETCSLQCCVRYMINDQDDDIGKVLAVLLRSRKVKVLFHIFDVACEQDAEGAPSAQKKHVSCQGAVS